MCESICVCFDATNKCTLTSKHVNIQTTNTERQTDMDTGAYKHAKYKTFFIQDRQNTQRQQTDRQTDRQQTETDRQQADRPKTQTDRQQADRQPLGRTRIQSTKARTFSIKDRTASLCGE